jgi:hypothetical protein
MKKKSSEARAVYNEPLNDGGGQTLVLIFTFEGANFIHRLKVVGSAQWGSLIRVP